MSIHEKSLIDLLQARRREDPKGFNKYLPGVADLLPELPPERSKSKSPFGLTVRELSYHRTGLAEALGKLREGAVTIGEAAKALQHCADLIKDDKLPDEAGYEPLKALVRTAIGKSPGSYKAMTTVPLGEDADVTVLESVSVIRGVYLNLDKEKRLVSISVHPGKVKERRRLMRVVGIGEDPEPDVSVRHDDYLARQDPHAAA